MSAGTCNGFELTRAMSPGSGMPVVVRDLGRGLLGVVCERSGVVAEELDGDGTVGDRLPGVLIV